MAASRHAPRYARRLTLPLFVTYLGIAACTETETQIVTVVDTIYVTVPRYEDLPEGAAGFVGYQTSESAPSTTCGDCHAGTQGRWVTTAHADAWAGLQSSAGAQESCEGCHTVNAMGNQTTADGGWTATGDTRYHDVQCESCHGPGQGHIDTPDVVAGPLAQVAVGVDPTIACGQCHSGTHHPFVEEWAESPHAGIVSFAATNPSCQSCHKGQGTLLAWGEDAEYVEKDDDPLAVTCAVCHDPHGSEHPADTRFSARSPDVDNNLCGKCHNRRTSPEEGSHGLAPHAPQAPLLLGAAGWFPPNMESNPGDILGTHGSSLNVDLCATCHVNSFEVTDEAGDFVKTVTGHLFVAIPCVDENGLPENVDCAYTTDDRTYGACTAAGCHGTEQVAASLLTVATQRIADRAGTLLDLLWEVDPNLDGPGGPIDPEDGVFTTAEGAFFNVNLAQFPNEGSEEPGDNPASEDVTSASTHNPFLVEALLIGSQQAVENEYGVGAAGHADYGPMIREIIRRAGSHRPAVGLD